MRRFYTFCATVTQILQKVRFPINSIWIRWLCPPCPNRGLRQAVVWPSCAKSRFLLSSPTFRYKFLCIPGRPISFRNYGIPGLPTRGPMRHPTKTAPKSSTNVLKGIANGDKERSCPRCNECLFFFKSARCPLLFTRCITEVSLSSYAFCPAF